MSQTNQIGFVAVESDSDFAPLFLQATLSSDFREKAQEVAHFVETHDMISCAFIPTGVELQDISGQVYPVTQATATNEGISFKLMDTANQLTFETDMLFFDQIESGEAACQGQASYFGTRLNPHDDLRTHLDSELAECIQDQAA